MSAEGNREVRFIKYQERCYEAIVGAWSGQEPRDIDARLDALSSALSRALEREKVLVEALENIKCEIRHDTTCVHLEDTKKKCVCIANYLYKAAKDALKRVKEEGK